MNVVVNFVSVTDIGRPGGVLMLSKCRIKEVFTAPGTTAAVVAADEVVIVSNLDATPILIAHGSTPDAAAGVATNATTAGVALPGIYTGCFAPSAGEKINIKAA